MDYNQLAADIISELKTLARRSDAEIAKRLGISRQAYVHRRDTNSLTTENITVLSAWLITGFGGGFYINKYWRNPVEDNTSELSRLSKVYRERARADGLDGLIGTDLLELLEALQSDLSKLEQRLEKLEQACGSNKHPHELQSLGERPKAHSTYKLLPNGDLVTHTCYCDMTKDHESGLPLKGEK